MTPDGLFAVFTFVIGLAIGLFQLYWSQRQFEAQQREKMDELRKTLTDIQQRVAVLQETSSQRAYDVQDKLIGLAASKEQVVASFTNDTLDRVQKVIEDEFSKAGMQNSQERTRSLNSTLTNALEQSASMLYDKVLLVDNMRRNFNRDEINILCWELGMNIDKSDKKSLSAKIDSLIDYCDVNGLTSQLILLCETARPGVTWK